MFHTHWQPESELQRVSLGQLKTEFDLQRSKPCRTPPISHQYLPFASSVLYSESFRHIRRANQYLSENQNQTDAPALPGSACTHAPSISVHQFCKRRNRSKQLVRHPKKPAHTCMGHQSNDKPHYEKRISRHLGSGLSEYSQACTCHCRHRRTTTHLAIDLCSTPHRQQKV